jgi:phosphotransferase system, enzyme I, PtsP
MTLASGTWLSVRRLLRQLRSLMASAEAPQTKLDAIVQLIASEMVAEVCSIYLRRPGDILELSATQGLKQEAVHKTRLYIGEGLVGDIAAHARPLALSEAQQHPNFAYKPETGEEIFHSLLGVPILREHKVLGVLVIQNRTPRHYLEEETEVMETIAMVLAELVSNTFAQRAEDIADTAGSALAPVKLPGIQLNRGLAIGRAVLHLRPAAIGTLLADDPEEERQRLQKAIDQLQEQIAHVLSSQEDLGEEQQDILEAYQLFTQDKGWRTRLHDAVQSGLTAEAAVQRVLNDTRVRLLQSSDAHLREKVYDLEDIAGKLMQHLSGQQTTIPEEGDYIVVARSLGPVDVLDYASPRLKGVVLEEGSPTSHVAIVAKMLNIPVVGRVDGISRHTDSLDTIVLDGDQALVYVRPPDDIKNRVLERMQAQALRLAQYSSERHLPTVSRDGVPIELLINAGMAADVRAIHECGAVGIGLYRTEIPFLLRRTLPDAASQAVVYREIYRAARGKEVVFRTLDIGGDKKVAYVPLPDDEENPAMGWRALRISLDRPRLLCEQLQALLDAAVGHRLSVMFPMVSDVAEFCQAKKLLLKEQRKRVEQGLPLPAHIAVGSMVEVPSLLWQLPALLAEVDFLSVGSNDLLQFFFASDRASGAMGNRYDALSPSVLRAMAEIARAATAHQKPVTVCGEMAGSPLEAMVLVGLGFRRLSMPPYAIGAIRTMIRSLHVGDLAETLRTMQDSAQHSVRETLRHYALDHAITL